VQNMDSDHKGTTNKANRRRETNKHTMRFNYQTFSIVYIYFYSFLLMFSTALIHTNKTYQRIEFQVDLSAKKSSEREVRIAIFFLADILQETSERRSYSICLKLTKRQTSPTKNPTGKKEDRKYGMGHTT